MEIEGWAFFAVQQYPIGREPLFLAELFGRRRMLRHRAHLQFSADAVGTGETPALQPNATVP